MRAQMKRVFAMLLTAMLVIDSQSSACSSLVSFGAGARNVLAADITEENIDDVDPGSVENVVVTAGDTVSVDFADGAAEDDTSYNEGNEADDNKGDEDAEDAADNEDASVEEDQSVSEDPVSANAFEIQESDTEMTESDQSAASGQEDQSSEEQFEEQTAEGSEAAAADASVSDPENTGDEQDNISIDMPEQTDEEDAAPAAENPEGYEDGGYSEDFEDAGNPEDTENYEEAGDSDGSENYEDPDASGDSENYEDAGDQDESFVENPDEEQEIQDDQMIDEDQQTDEDQQIEEGEDTSSEAVPGDEGQNVEDNQDGQAVDGSEVPGEETGNEPPADTLEETTAPEAGQTGTEEAGAGLTVAPETAEENLGADSVLVTAVFGDDNTPISEAYTGLSIPVTEEGLDLTKSPIEGDVTRAVPVEGTQRLYVESFKYDRATIDGAEITSLAKKDITENTVVFLHYSSTQKKTKYVYNDQDIKVVAVVQDPEAIPDNAILSVTQITADQNKVAFDAYMTALNNNSDQIAEQAAREEVSEYNAENTLLYDIAFLVPKADEEGNVLEGQYVEIQPAGNAVSVNMQFKGKQLSKDLKAENTEDIQIVHLPIADALVGDVDKTQDIIEGSEQKLYTGDEIADNITPEAMGVRKANLTEKTENVIFDAPTFSAYAVTLAGGNNINFNVKVRFCDDEGNAIPQSSISLDGNYYLVAYVNDNVTMSWGVVEKHDYIYVKQIVPDNNSECSMTINNATLAQFQSYYWWDYRGDYLSGPYDGKVVEFAIAKDAIGNYENNEIRNGQNIGAFTLEMTGPATRTLDASGSTEDIIINAVKGGYKYEVQFFENDGVTPVIDDKCGLENTYYVIAKIINNDDKTYVDGDVANGNIRYFIEKLNTENLNGGKQSGFVDTFRGQFWPPNAVSYALEDDVVVELVTSENMFDDVDDPVEPHYNFGEIFSVGSYLEDKFKVESITVNESNTKSIVKLVKNPACYVKKDIVKLNNGTELDTSNYYVLSEMEKSDGTISRYLEKWDDIPAEGYRIGDEEEIEVSSQNASSYSPNKNVTVKLLKANGELTLGANGVIGTYREAAEGQMMDGFQVSCSEEKPETGSHSRTITLTELESGQDYPVEIKFLDHYGEPDSPNLTDDYYLLATLKPSDGSDNLVAWALEKITWDDSATTSILLENNSFNVCDTAFEATGEMTGFNPDNFTISTRIFRSIDGTELNSYNDVIANGRDDVLNYDFVSNVQEFDGDNKPIKSVITLKNSTNKTYTVNVEGTDKLATSGKKYYVFLKAEHASTPDTYALSNEMTLTGSFSEVIPDESWVLASGAAGDPFTGNETMKYYIVETAADAAKPAETDVIAALNGGGSNSIRVYDQNALFDGTAAAKFVFDSRDRVEDIHDTEVTDKLVIKAATATRDYDLESIMGAGMLYGVTADFFNPQGHLQTNFAANRFNPCMNGNYGWVHPNLAGNPGTIAMASIDEGKDFRLEDDESLTAIPIIIDPLYRSQVKTQNHDNLVPPGYIVDLDSNQISNQIVNPIINHMKQISQELLTHEDTFAPPIEEYAGTATLFLNSEHEKTINVTCADLDVTGFDENATIYIDGERYLKYLAQPQALNIKKWPNQVVVFNFDSATNVDLNTFRIQYKNEDDSWQEPFSTQSEWDLSADHREHTIEVNEKVGFAAQTVVFNCANAENVQTGGACGMFLLPKEESVLTIQYESGAGWIASAGTVTSDNTFLRENGFDTNWSCFEWHGLYAEMPDASNASLTLRKTVNGDDADSSELFTFEIDRYKEELGQNIDNEEYWEKVKEINNSGSLIFYTVKNPTGDPIIYRVKETEVKSADGSYSFDDTVFYARIKRIFVSEGKYVATVDYYNDFDKAFADSVDDKLTTTPTFKNKELPVYGPVLTKKLTYNDQSGHVVEKEKWPKNGFVFSIAVDTENTDSDLVNQAVYRVVANSTITLEIPVNNLDAYISNFESNIADYELTDSEKNNLLTKLEALASAKANIANNKRAAFKDITFRKAGSYVFTITENVPEGAENNVKDHIQYSQDPVKLTVNVEDQDGVLVIDSVSYEQGTEEVEADTASEISSLSFEYKNIYIEEIVPVTTGKLTFTKTVTGGVTQEEAEGALTFTIQNETTGKYLLVSEEGEVSWVETETELSLEVLSKLTTGYTVTEDAENGFLFTVVLDDVEPGTYTITEKNSAIQGFGMKSSSVTTDSNELAAGEEVDIELIDDYEKLGTLELTKTIKGEVTEDEYNGALTFEITTTEGEGETQKTLWLGKDGELKEAKEELTLADFEDLGNKQFRLVINTEEYRDYTVTETAKDIDGNSVTVSYKVTQDETES
ncbi:hypothetical protein SAMN04487833_12630, partial [Sarcina sp. DSM 11001]|uniref:hypothetical protein n=1 Tax=Sarcina sp. DSM 11001 TaxID=1798184 RepID=UPI0008909B9B